MLSIQGNPSKIQDAKNKGAAANPQPTFMVPKLKILIAPGDRRSKIHLLISG